MIGSQAIRIALSSAMSKRTYASGAAICGLVETIARDRHPSSPEPRPSDYAWAAFLLGRQGGYGWAAEAYVHMRDGSVDWSNAERWPPEEG